MKCKVIILIYPLVIIGLLLMITSSCKKKEDSIQWETGTVTDVEGNVYKTVKIGTQWWMAENLKTTKYNDGTFIPLLENASKWVEPQTAPCYCWYKNDPVKYKNTYGALYNWFATNTGKLAPTGWHIPTEAEIDTLIEFLGGEYVAGGKMKTTGSLDKGTGIWSQPNEGATNSSGFSGVPGGYRYLSDEMLGSNGNWWYVLQPDNPEVAGYFNLRGVMAWCQKTATFNKATGYSVRCIKDE